VLELRCSAWLVTRVAFLILGLNQFAFYIVVPPGPLGISGEQDALAVIQSLILGSRTQPPALSEARGILQVGRFIGPLPELSRADIALSVTPAALFLAASAAAFGRADHVRSSGLGLYVIQRIVESHGGVSVERELGHGATFSVAPPAVEALS
jgi:hypothetical protein